MTLLFDVGGVILSNAWDHQQRAAAATHFSLDRAEIEARHAPVAVAMESGQITLDDYLDTVVFDRPRAFTFAQFRAFMESLSQPMPESLALLEELRANGAAMATLNNEGRELNAYRIQRFGLGRYFRAFCTSCYLGARKPDAEIYRRALGILQAEAASCLFIDDREENLVAAAALGLGTHHFTSAAALRAELTERGVLGRAAQGA